MSAETVRVSDQVLREMDGFSKIVALRWDVLPNVLVMDIDFTPSEASDTPTYRAWMAFRSVKDLSWSLARQGFNLGIWISGPAVVDYVAEGGVEFGIGAIAKGESIRNDERGMPGWWLSITADRMVTVRSASGCIPDGPFVSPEARRGLCSDAVLTTAVRSELNRR